MIDYELPTTRKSPHHIVFGMVRNIVLAGVVCPGDLISESYVFHNILQDVRKNVENLFDLDRI